MSISDSHPWRLISCTEKNAAFRIPERCWEASIHAETGGVSLSPPASGTFRISTSLCLGTFLPLTPFKKKKIIIIWPGICQRKVPSFVTLRSKMSRSDSFVSKPRNCSLSSLRLALGIAVSQIYCFMCVHSEENLGSFAFQLHPKVT